MIGLNRVGQLVRGAWRYSLLVTLPLTVFFLYLGVGVGYKYYDFGIRSERSVDVPSLHGWGDYEVHRLERKWNNLVLADGLQAEDDLPQIHLMINRANEGQLNSNLPRSGRAYKEGFLLYPGGGMGEVDLRYRGDFAWHWATEKKSWRVKTPKNAMWNNMRKFNMVVPKGMAMLEDTLGHWLAGEMGLIAPRSGLTELVVNGKGRGLHTMVEQLEELVLRRNGRMPGDIFAGELIGRDSHVGLANIVFDHPGLWGKASINNHFDPDENAALVRLCELLNSPATEERHTELRSLLDVEAFGRFAAFRVLTQSKHFDRTHNWRLYYDPWKNRFEPVVWDTVPWHKDWMPRPDGQPFLEPLFCRLDDVLAQDHQYRIAMDRSLRNFFESGLRDQLMQRFDGIVETMSEALDRDPVLTFKLRYVTPLAVRIYQRELRAGMNKLFDALRWAHVDEPPLLRGSSLSKGSDFASWRLGLYGRRPIEGIRIELEEPIEFRPLVSLRYEVDGVTRSLDVSPYCKVNGKVVEIDCPLLGSLIYQANPDSKSFADRGTMAIRVGTFDITLRSSTGASISVIRIAALFGEDRAKDIEVLADLPVYPFEREFGIVIEPQPVRSEIWEGAKIITGKQTLQRHVIIREGTAILMEPGASLIFEGGLIAEGSAEHPIIVQRRNLKDAAWGTFALRGPRADDSILRHVQFAGGSGWKRPIAEYSSMFSIHWVQGVRVENCTFSDSSIVDDMVHGVYSGVEFIGCKFYRSFSDALDMDISDVLVDGCLFEGSGNDAVDLMTARAVVIGSVFRNNKDKGISIGENSYLLAIDNLFDSCEIALQSKDQSVAAIANCDIRRCNVGVDAYRKNWRYNGGGEIYLYKSRLTKNNTAVRRDKHSVVGLADTFVDNLPRGWSSRFLRGAAMSHAAGSTSAATPGQPYRFDAEKRALGSLGQSRWRLVRDKHRGSTHPQLP